MPLHPPELDLVALGIFVATVIGIILLPLDRLAVTLAGLVALILATEYTHVEAFRLVEWDVIMILLGMWIIAEYISRSSLPEAIVEYLTSRVASYSRLMFSMLLVVGFVSLFLDNVLVILLFSKLAIDIARASGRSPLTAALLVGIAANYMGTGLLMGDLPPQLLHVIAGAEFMDFIVFRGRPGSLLLLLASFALTLLILYRFLFSRGAGRAAPVTVRAGGGGVRVDRELAVLSVSFLVITMVLMALRPLLGVKLGFITFSTAVALSLAVELMKRRRPDLPGLEEILQSIEWRALIFYAALFSLVGGLEVNGVIEFIASRILVFLEGDPLVAYTVFYAVTGLLSMVIEHDALLLAMLYIVRDAAELAGIDPWPIYWGLAWAATLGSNATIAGAPALYVAVNIAEREVGRVSGLSILKVTVPFATVSLAIHYVLTVLLFL